MRKVILYVRDTFFAHIFNTLMFLIHFLFKCMEVWNKLGVHWYKEDMSFIIIILL